MIQISLKAARVNSDLTQKEVVKILRESYNVEITRQRLADYENDSTNIPIKLAKQLANIYGISDEYIFFGNKSTLSYTIRLENFKKLKVKEGI